MNASSPAIDIIAHRGASADAPENTAAAFKLAIEYGADGFESDYYLTRDGKIICIHDNNTKRTTGIDGKVPQMTLAELRRLDAGSWKGSKFGGEKLPTLEEALALVPPGKKTYVEIKCGAEIVPEFKRVVEACKLQPEQIVVISFQDDAIAAVKATVPKLKAYWLFSLKKQNGKWNATVDELIARAKRLGADGIDINYTATTAQVVNKEFVSKCKAAGLEVHLWTVDDAQLARQAAQIGVASITTNKPKYLREQLGQGSPK
jgi:glycerophosphoryl diester phosphodiesterase